MTDNNKSMEVQKQEITPTEETERTRDVPCFVPRADIFENEDEIIVVVDVPGADEEAIDITLEKNILTINAYVEPILPEGYGLTHAEYEACDYQRSFRLSDEIDREKIDATIRDGILRVFLPKSGAARTRKISVKTGYAALESRSVKICAENLLIKRHRNQRSRCLFYFWKPVE